MPDRVADILSAYEPTLRQRIGDATYDVARYLGMDNIANRMRGDVQAAVDFIPGVGDAVGIDETVRDYQAGNYGMAAAGLGLTAVGMAPGVGDAASAAGRRLLNGLEIPNFLYHGSPEADFSDPNFSFEIGRQRSSADSPSNAVYLTPDQSAALEYTEGSGLDGVGRFETMIESPLDLRSEEGKAELIRALDPENRYGVSAYGEHGGWTRPDDWYQDDERKSPLPSFDEYGSFWDWAIDVSGGQPNEFMNDISSWAQNSGYDSMIFSDANRGTIADSYAVFDPSILKLNLSDR